MFYMLRDLPEDLVLIIDSSEIAQICEDLGIDEKYGLLLVKMKGGRMVEAYGAYCRTPYKNTLMSKLEKKMKTIGVR